MDGPGRCIDNILRERTWRTMKYEHIFLHGYRTLGELRRGLKDSLDFFNRKRLHQGLDYQTPDAVYYGVFLVKGMEQWVA